MSPTLRHVRRGQTAGSIFGWVRRLTGRLASLAGAAALACLLALGALMATGHRPMVEQSDSMAPVMRAGDVLLVKRITAAEARPGDVVTFADPESPRRTITHRVVSVSPARSGGLAFVTRGDANTGEERWRASRTASIGRYVARVPSAGYAVRYATSSAWRGLVLLAGLLLTVDVCRRLWRTPPTSHIHDTRG